MYARIGISARVYFLDCRPVSCGANILAASSDMLREAYRFLLAVWIPLNAVPAVSILVAASFSISSFLVINP